MWAYIIAFSAGILFFHIFASPPWWWCLELIVLLFFLYLLFSSKYKIIFNLSLSFVLGFFWILLRLFLLTQWHIPSHLINKPVLVEGRVSTFISKKNINTLTFGFKMTRFQEKDLTKTIQLTWYESPKAIQVGEVWRFYVKLKPPNGLLNNIGELNYKNWLIQQGISATGHIVFPSRAVLLAPPDWQNPVLRIRAIIAQYLEKWIKNVDILALMNALVVGSHHLFSPAIWNVLQNTGTSHLVAISGLHVGIITSACYVLIFGGIGFFPIILVKIPAPKVAALGAMLIAIFYSLLVGMALPTERSLIMVLVLMFSILMGYRQLIWHRLGLAFLIIIIIDPFALTSASFWLSFTAVMFIIHGMKGQNQQNKLYQGISVQFVVFVGLLPLTLYYFHQLSLMTFFANFVAIPWITLLIVPLCLIASFMLLLSKTGAKWLFLLAAKLLSLLWIYLKWLAHWPWAVWYHPIYYFYIFILAIIAAIFLVAPPYWQGRKPLVLCWLPLFFLKPSTPPLNSLWLTILDVGQGLAVVLRTAHHTLLYDTGPRYPNGFDAGKNIIIPYFQWHQLAVIDLLIISHSDMDHRGGVNTLLKTLEVKTFLTSDPQRFRAYKAQACYNGQHWRWDGVEFELLAPPRYKLYQGNNSSCVLRVEAQGKVVLLPGDIEWASEQRLLAKYKKKLKASLLIVPHHGSRTSSSWVFLKAVHPRYAIFSTGFYNQYHFPHPKIIQRYKQLGTQLFNTATQGAINIKIDPREPLLINAAAYE